MEKFSPGANVGSDYYHVCDNCMEDDGRPILFWEFSEREGHFALCLGCLKEIYMIHASHIDKIDESLIVNRKIISEEFRNFIFDRDGGKCQKCGANKNLCLDHIIPFSVGGRTNESNLQTLCRNCNSQKGAKWNEKAKELSSQ